MPRKRFAWKFGKRSFVMGERTYIMGILNVTPDSFSDGGQFLDPDAAVARALELQEQGADILDIGAESTRPGAEPVSEEEEWRRLEPVLQRLQGVLTIPISVDTYKSGVARKALELGAEIINDPTGGTLDPLMPKTVGQANAGLILNHMRGTPETWARMPKLVDAPGSVLKELDASVGRALHANVPRHSIVVDPGLGFGKKGDQNAELLARLSVLGTLELPILIGASRKSFLARENAEETLASTAAALALAIANGAHIVRVHDVAAMRSAAQIADLIGSFEAPAPERRKPNDGPRYGEEAPRRPIRPVLKEAPPKEAPPKETFKEQREAPAAEQRPYSDRPRYDDRPQGDRPPRRFEQREGPPRRDYRENTGSDQRPPRDSGDRGPSDRPRQYSDRPPRFGGRDERSSQPPREGQYGDRPPRFGDREQRQDRPPRESQPYNDRSAPRGGGQYSDRSAPRAGGGYSDRPPRQDSFRNDRPSGDNRGPQQGDRFAPRGEGPRPFGDRQQGPPRSGDRRPPFAKPFNKPFRKSGPPSRSGGARPPRKRD